MSGKELLLDDHLQHTGIDKAGSIVIVRQDDDGGMLLRIIPHKARIAREVASVPDHAGEIDDAQPIAHPMPEPEQGLPVNGEGDEGQPLPLHGWAEQRAGCQGLRPDVQIMQRRDGASRRPAPGRVPIGHVGRHGGCQKEVAVRVWTGERL